MTKIEATRSHKRPTSRIKTYVAIALGAILVDALLIGGWCLAFLPQGQFPQFMAYHGSLAANFLIAVLLYVSLAGIPLMMLLMLIALIFLRHAWAHKTVSVALGLLIVFGLFIPMFWLAPMFYWPIHFEAVRTVPPRGAPLVEGIEAYREAHGGLPQNLEALVPAYLDAIPTTGLAGFPNFQYRILPEHDYYGTRYELFMPCPYSYAGPSAVLYWPEENGYLASWPEDARQRRRDWDDWDDWVYVNMK